MKFFRRFQKTAIAVGMIYGVWLGGQDEASTVMGVSAIVIVALSATVALSMFAGKEQNQSEKKQA